MDSDEVEVMGLKLHSLVERQARTVFPDGKSMCAAFTCWLRNTRCGCCTA